MQKQQEENNLKEISIDTIIEVALAMPKNDTFVTCARDFATTANLIYVRRASK